ncbi:Cation transport protein chaC [Rubellimicrobium mesophilum DSM 19309]|uniref:glutathione-specific gamma-glutamylcyclotransferase n=1 Tax=Rubellimicrobium mesophilum DSM 19309 TaxID=442562 RepID=A0A017HN80_9RHOB|nr:gamma-glutamylcyclotransferase [Rubellimicrobium mesophilum]EYD75780.1 Cation transport protein chaC [Rubellimicrobium mesophilum DSM 19309]
MHPSSFRTLHLTEDHVARATRPVEEFSYPSSFARASEEDYAALVDRLVAERPEGPLHVFAYGSLIWKPTFEAVARRRAVARGWHRQFALVLRGHRATPEAPGLMMTLMPGGRCAGLALEVRAGEERRVLEDSIRREFPFVETLAYRRWLRLDTAEGPIRGLVFWAGPTGSGVQRGLPLEEAAWQIARACGPKESNAEYLRNTVASLEEHGIRDRNLWRLQRLVAQEIDGHRQ